MASVAGSDEGSVIVTNCATALLGGHRAAEARTQGARLRETQRRFIETCVCGEFLLLAGDRRLAMRIEPPAQHRAILRAANTVRSSE